MIIMNVNNNILKLRLSSAKNIKMAMEYNGDSIFYFWKMSDSNEYCLSFPVTMFRNFMISGVVDDIYD